MKIISSELYVKDNKVYHEGNKPKPKDIGAAPETHTHNYASATTPGGSAEHAIKATEDSLGQRIDKYIKGLSVSGRTITYTRGDGTTGTITTQDNDTDTKVTNTLNTTAKAYITGTTNSATNTGTQVFDTNVYLDTTAGMLTATTFKGALQGNATTATSATSASHAAKLTTPRSINGTNFDGTAAITTANWGTARTLTIGNTGKSVNGSGNVSWSIGEIGAAPASHNHTSLTGITNLSFAAEGSDSASITTTVDGANTYFDFNLSDDPSQNDMWRWRFRPSGGNLFNAMTLDAISITEAKLAVTGEVQATRLKGTLTGDVKGNVTGAVSGNAGSATKLATARTINGTSFDGTANITTANWGAARNIQIGNTSKSVNGSANISWTLDEVGAASRSPFSNTYKQITVGGDANTYYPVLITMNRPGIGYPWYNISISRAYNATAPDTWHNATHRGGLTFQFRWSGDTGWGGNDHNLQVVEFHESYTTMVAGFTLSVSGIVVWLRGGGALYQLNCEQGIGINATVTLGTYTSADDKTYPVRTNTNSVANEIHRLWVQRGGEVYDNNSRVYSANNKPTPAAIGALSLSGGTLTGLLSTPNNQMGIKLGDDALIGDGNIANNMVLQGVQDSTLGGITFGSGKDTNIYRGGANLLKTDDTMNAVGGFQWNGQSLDNRYAAASHSHSHLPLSGGTMTGTLALKLGGSALTGTGINTGNTQLIGTAEGTIYFGNPKTNIVLESISTPSVSVNGTTYAMYHTGNKPTASEIGAAASNHTHDYAPVGNGVQRWNSVIKCATWSRIMYLSRHTTVGHSGIINIQGTRTAVVFNATFIINTSHPSKAYITQINNTNYSNFQIRAVTNNEGDAYIEVYDNANGATNATTQTLNVSYTAISGIGAGTLTKYTAFTDGTTIPTNFAEAHKITTVNGSHYSGNAATATKLQTVRTINGTSFDGSANITTANWGTARNIQIGNTSKSVNGSGNVSWSLSEIGALPLAGSTMTGPIKFNSSATSSDASAPTQLAHGLLGSYSSLKILANTDNNAGADNEYVHIAAARGLSPATNQGIVVYGTYANAFGSRIVTEASGTAKTAAKLATARTIALGGILSGSASFDGSGNVTINAAANDITTITKSLNVTTSWADTGITGSNLGTGTYAVQMYINDGTNTSQYQEYYSGIMSWYNGGTNSTDADEILLHKAGHASNGRHLYLRTIRTPNSGYLKLQISCTHAFSAASNITFKFKKLI